MPFWFSWTSTLVSGICAENSDHLLYPPSLRDVTAEGHKIIIQSHATGGWQNQKKQDPGLMINTPHLLPISGFLKARIMDQLHQQYPGAE